MCTVNRQQLIEDNINLVYFVVHTYYPTFVNDEDIIQCGMLGLCMAAESWDAEQGAFSTFATRCISNQIIKEFRARKKYKGVLSLEYEYADGEGEGTTLADTIIGTLDVDWADLDGLYDILTEKERMVIDLRRKGMTQYEIADRLGMSQQMVCTHLRRARRRLEKKNGY